MLPSFIFQAQGAIGALSSIEMHEADLSQAVMDAMFQSISNMFDTIADIISDTDEEGDLEVYKKDLDPLGAYISLDPTSDKNLIDDKIDEINNRYEHDDGTPSKPVKVSVPRLKQFDDDDIQSMFSSFDESEK